MKEHTLRRKLSAVSNIGFAVVVVILLIVAVGGFGLYSTRPVNVITSTFTKNSGGNTTITVSSPKLAQTPGFYNGTVVVFSYPREFNCTPGLLNFFSNESAASQITNCVVGAGTSTAESGAVPLWVVVPAFAGLSIFGVQTLGASPLGYPTFSNQTILTDCGAGGTPSGCPDHPHFLYSPFFTAVEQHLNLTNGYGGLPEGVLPTPSHDHLINCCFQIIPWYTIVVLDFDPNIFPNPVTAQCVRVVPSNLTRPTANCLSSFQGLVAALTTASNSTIKANQNNPIWQTLGGPTTQIVIPGVASAAQINNANTNLFEHFTVNSTNPYLYNATG